MKRILVFLAAALTAFSVAQAESDTDSTFVFGPADTETAAPEVTPSPTPIPLLEDNGDSSFDFSQVDNPLATRLRSIPSTSRRRRLRPHRITPMRRIPTT